MAGWMDEWMDGLKEIKQHHPMQPQQQETPCCILHDSSLSVLLATATCNSNMIANLRTTTTTVIAPRMIVTWPLNPLQSLSLSCLQQSGFFGFCCCCFLLIPIKTVMKMIPFFVSQGKNDEKKPTTSYDIFLVLLLLVLLLLAACFTAHICKESRQAGRQSRLHRKRIENTCCLCLRSST